MKYLTLRLCGLLSPFSYPVNRLRVDRLFAQTVRPDEFAQLLASLLEQFLHIAKPESQRAVISRFCNVLKPQSGCAPSADPSVVAGIAPQKISAPSPPLSLVISTPSTSSAMTLSPLPSSACSPPVSTTAASFSHGHGSVASESFEETSAENDEELAQPTPEEGTRAQAGHSGSPSP